jgi:hypothetical protein
MAVGGGIGVRVAIAVFVVALTQAAAATATGVEDFQVVVHPSVKGTWISRANLSALFTRKADHWGNKAAARPVDQSLTSPVRQAFTATVLGRSIGEL